MRVKMFGLTDTGRVRKQNQDSFYINEELGFAICADGIGGRKGGEVASRLAVETVKKNIFDHIKNVPPDKISKLVNASIDKSNREILKVGSASSSISGMGTTINVLYFSPSQVYIGHIGDSRTYLFAKDSFFQLTVDHSIAVYIEKGWLPPDSMGNKSKPGALVRALGLSDSCEADIYEKKIYPGELYLTCSDGLSGMVPDYKIREIMRQYRDQTEKIPEILIALANRNGGQDNITVVISEVIGDN